MNMAVHGRSFHRTLLTASGNEMLAALADVVAEVLTGRTTHGLMPATPEPTAVRLHADVAQAVQARDEVAAHRAMTEIISEATESMLRTSAP
jgi:DNA-binding FadR family transcriptional regulator